MYERVAYFLPQAYKERLKQQMIYAGFERKDVEKIAGFSVAFGGGIGLVVFFNLTLLGFGLMAVLAGLLTWAAFVAFVYIALNLIGDSRAREIEYVLPDCLQLISANIRAGMTVDKAIWLSARPEFGILEDEIRKVGVKTVGGKPIKKALQEFAARIKSGLVDRAVKLLIEGMESGGELAHLIEETSVNVRTSQSLRKEIGANVMMYSLFIMFAAVIGAPALFAISLYFIEITAKMWGPQMLTQAQFAGGFIRMTGPQISPAEIFYFAVACIAVTTFFSSLIMGLIQYGQEKRGIKYMLPLTASAFAVFFAVRFMLSTFFGTMIVV